MSKKITCPPRLVPKEERPRPSFPGDLPNDGCTCRSHTRAAELGTRADRCLANENDPDPEIRQETVKDRALLASPALADYRDRVLHP